MDEFGLLMGIKVLARRFGDSCLAQLNCPFRLSFRLGLGDSSS